MKQGFAAFAAGDLATLDSLFADDIIWHGSGRSFLGGDFAGKEAVFGLFGRPIQETDSFEQQVRTVLADDEHAVALVDAKASRDGKHADMQQVFVFRVSRGQIKEAWVTMQDQYAADKFWA